MFLIGIDPRPVAGRTFVPPRTMAELDFFAGLFPGTPRYLFNSSMLVAHAPNIRFAYDLLIRAVTATSETHFFEDAFTKQQLDRIKYLRIERFRLEDTSTDQSYGAEVYQAITSDRQLPVEGTSSK
jgi:hypothetical protein